MHHSSPSTRRTSIGHFLCAQDGAPRTERVDSFSGPDVKQDAVMRVLPRLERPHSMDSLSDHDLIDAIDQQTALAVNAYRWAQLDAMRHHLGRGGRPRRAPASLDDIQVDVADGRTPLDAVEARVCLDELAKRGWGDVSPSRWGR